MGDESAHPLSNFLILLWTPAMLHGAGAAPSHTIFATSIYGLAITQEALLTAFFGGFVSQGLAQSNNERAESLQLLGNPKRPIAVAACIADEYVRHARPRVGPPFAGDWGKA
jgi:hypothetical protein